jgi:hypothetical protein
MPKYKQENLGLFESGEDAEDEHLWKSIQSSTEPKPRLNNPKQGGAKRGKNLYVKVPLWWIEEAAQAMGSPRTLVAIWLLHLQWKARSMTFPVPNGRLGKRGVDKQVKRRVLADLEAGGLITVARSHGKTPIVTLVCL